MSTDTVLAVPETKQDLVAGGSSVGETTMKRVDDADKVGSSSGAHILYVCGDESGVGKTTVCMGILCGALQLGYKPEELAYIKPCTQCEDVQLLWKWCEAEGIDHNGIGPILYRAGYTQEVIDGKHGTAAERIAKVKAAVHALTSSPVRFGEDSLAIETNWYP